METKYIILIIIVLLGINYISTSNLSLERFTQDQNECSRGRINDEKYNYVVNPINNTGLRPH